MANDIRLVQILLSLKPNFTNLHIDNNTEKVRDWGDNTPISDEDINAERVRLQADYDAQDYARKRKAEYPSIQDLVVALYDTDDKTAIEAKRAEIKLKYPKP